MLRNRSVQGPVAAWAAVLCVMASPIFAEASVSDFSPPPVHATGERYPTPTVHSAERNSVRLAQQPSDTDGSGEAIDESEGKGSPENPENEAAGPEESEGDAFHGSAEPAGPDLTVDEERSLISRGWD